MTTASTALIGPMTPVMSCAHTGRRRTGSLAVAATRSFGVRALVDEDLEQPDVRGVERGADCGQQELERQPATERPGCRARKRRKISRTTTAGAASTNS